MSFAAALGFFFLKKNMANPDASHWLSQGHWLMGSHWQLCVGTASPVFSGWRLPSSPSPSTMPPCASSAISTAASRCGARSSASVDCFRENDKDSQLRHPRGHQPLSDLQSLVLHQRRRRVRIMSLEFGDAHASVSSLPKTTTYTTIAA